MLKLTEIEVDSITNEVVSEMVRWTREDRRRPALVWSKSLPWSGIGTLLEDLAEMLFRQPEDPAQDLSPNDEAEMDLVIALVRFIQDLSPNDEAEMDLVIALVRFIASRPNGPAALRAYLAKELEAQAEYDRRELEIEARQREALQ